MSPAYIVGKSKVESVGAPVRVGGRIVRTGDIMLLDYDGAVCRGALRLHAGPSAIKYTF